ncbi:hypothetical protein CCICO_04465 [Corynebacterium ciconiae DSM 44920]|uniref:hypothetical protein n=1 Tax=Corynebacterium ciconiae TaxID=227319 RepID=UPI00264898F2|nr:hypothetical protein [Corynebacterium ciconiae]WKD60930.1 hypothetical protein CCICO_04465 [Corynebacterium ciconiae DSM 44920]
MATLICDVRSIVGRPVQGTVTVYADAARKHSSEDAVIVGVRETTALVDGQCTIENIQPGAAVVIVDGQGVRLTLRPVIPDGEVKLSEVLQTVDSPPVGVLDDLLRRVAVLEERIKE